MLPLVAIIESARPVASIQQAQAESILLARLREDRAFPNIKSECLYLVLDDQTSSYYQFSVRFDQAKCGGDSASDLLDRFVVMKANGEVKYYDVASVQIRPYKWFLQHRRGQ
jgi:hypothetical protein